MKKINKLFNQYLTFSLLLFFSCVVNADDKCLEMVRNSEPPREIWRAGLDAKKVGVFLCELKDAIKDKNKEKISEMIDYPTETTIDNVFLVIKTKSEIVKNFDKIFNKKVVDAISASEYEMLESSWQGVDVKDGIV